MRAAALALLMLWAYGAGVLFGHSEARKAYCGDEYPALMPLLQFAWPVAAVALAVSGSSGTEPTCAEGGE